MKLIKQLHQLAKDQDDPKLRDVLLKAADRLTIYSALEKILLKMLKRLDKLLISEAFAKEIVDFRMAVTAFTKMRKRTSRVGPKDVELIRYDQMDLNNKKVKLEACVNCSLPAVVSTIYAHVVERTKAGDEWKRGYCEVFHHTQRTDMVAPSLPDEDNACPKIDSESNSVPSAPDVTVPTA